MSIENPNQHLHSEDSTEVLPEFNSKDHIVWDEQFTDEIIEHYKQYYPEAIYNTYKEKSDRLHLVLAKLENYLLAKKLQPSLAQELIHLLTDSSASKYTIKEREEAFEKIETIIQKAEGQDNPDEIFKEAKNAFRDLNEQVTDIAKIVFVAKNNPELN